MESEDHSGTGRKREQRERERKNLCFDIKGIENSHGRLLSNHRTNVCNELARSR